MHTYRHIHTLGNLSSGRAHTHTFIRPTGTPSFPSDPVPSLPLPSHLPGPIPSIKLQKQVSQQPGRGKVSVCPSPTPSHLALPAPSLHQCQAGDAHTSAACDCTMGHMKETRASTQPHTNTPRHPASSLASGYPKMDSLGGCQAWFGVGRCCLKPTAFFPPLPLFKFWEKMRWGLRAGGHSSRVEPEGRLGWWGT